MLAILLQYVAPFAVTQAALALLIWREQRHEDKAEA